MAQFLDSHNPDDVSCTVCQGSSGGGFKTTGCLVKTATNQNGESQNGDTITVTILNGDRQDKGNITKSNYGHL